MGVLRGHRQLDVLDAGTEDPLDDLGLWRSTPYLTHPVFHSDRSETELLRYLRRLADADLALDRTDDPVGLLHDEAQCHHRDGTRHLAGVRRVCTPSRPLGGLRGHPAS